MALRLRVVSDHRRSLGDRCNIVFGVGGGTIGRSADNDWVLPDPLRYVSAHHARVSFRQGAYFLEDLSTNGVYVNDGEKPLGQAGPHRLANGDLLRFGDYQVGVVLEVRGRGRRSRPPPPRLRARSPSRPASTRCAPSAAPPRRTSAPRSTWMPCWCRTLRSSGSPSGTWPPAAASAP